MWGSFLDTGKALAEQAVKRAAELEGQLNESAGIQPSSHDNVPLATEDDDALDDKWDDDEEDMIPEKQHESADEDSAAAAAAGGWAEDDEALDLDESTKDAQEDLDSAPQPPKEDTPKEEPPVEDALEEEAPMEETPEVLGAAEETEPELVYETSMTKEESKNETPPADEKEVERSSPPAHEATVEEEQDKTLSSGQDEILEEEKSSPAEVAPPEDSPPKPETADVPPEPVESAELEVAPPSIAEEGKATNETDATGVDESSSSQISAVPPHSVDSEELARIMEQQAEYTRMMEAKMEDLQQRLAQREDQLFSKTEQLTTNEEMHEQEKQELLQKIQHTKEEAKRRIQKAKERVEAMEQTLKNATSSKGSSAEEIQKQAEIISALREEGEKLARKQLDMEAAVRGAKGEARELRETLEETVAAQTKALDKISTLEAELKSTKDDLSSARKGESQAGKLDSDLRHVREESEKRAATILSLEQQVKELKATQKELQHELESTRTGAAVETEQEIKKLRKDHNDLIADLESKVQRSERDAAVREDALRHEVGELRKRWQDAVRRADALSVDAQSSTAPLLRQLESTNKQNRARAAAWAELETQLRSELEESVISNEQLAKERSEWKTKCTRLERATKENETELKQVKGELHDKSEKVQQLQHELEKMKAEGEKMKAEWAEVERLANEGVSRVRSEMTRTVVDAEERHRSQIESMEAQLAQERDKILQMQKQFDVGLGKGVAEVADEPSLPLATVVEDRPKRLRNSEGQADILAGALGAFGRDGDNSDEDDDENDNSRNSGGGANGSFAALEQLTSRLKASKVEIKTLRNRLAESEKSREELVKVLGESRNAREKLPLLESQVQELTEENKQLSQEVEGLREDIVDVRELYRTQMNVLLEAHAAATPQTNGKMAPIQGSPESNDVVSTSAGDSNETTSEIGHSEAGGDTKSGTV